MDGQELDLDHIQNCVIPSTPTKVIVDYPAGGDGAINIFEIKEGRYSERLYLEFVRTDKWGVKA